MNLEYLLVDSRTFVTAEDDALHTFFGAGVDSSTSYRAEIEVCVWGGGGGGEEGLSSCSRGDDALVVVVRSVPQR